MRAFFFVKRGVLGGFPGFQALKADAFLAEQDPQALMADVVDHPLSHQEVRQLGQAPGGERQVMPGWLGLGNLLDLPPLAQRELRRMAASVLRVERIEPVGVEVPDHIATRSWLVKATLATASTLMP